MIITYREIYFYKIYKFRIKFVRSEVYTVFKDKTIFFSSLIVLHLDDFQVQHPVCSLCGKQDDIAGARPNERNHGTTFVYGRVVLRRYKTNSFQDFQNGLLIDMVSSVVRERESGQV